MHLITTKEISAYLKHTQYFNKLKKQLSKDFGDESFTFALEELKIQDAKKLNSIVSQYLTSFERKNTQEFFQILYRVDIPESEFKAQVLFNELDIQDLSDLVIRRELIKILFREKYSSI